MEHNINLSIMGVSEVQEREKGARRLFNKIMAKNSQTS